MLKDLFYRPFIRLDILCGIECWAIKEQNVEKMRKQKWRCLALLEYHIWNELALIEKNEGNDNLGDQSMSWIDHISANNWLEKTRPNNMSYCACEWYDCIGSSKCKWLNKIGINNSCSRRQLQWN